MSCDSGWCDEKSVKVVEDLARAADVIRARGGDEELAAHLHGALYDALKLMAFHTSGHAEADGWNPRDAQDVLTGAISFRTLETRYRACDDDGYRAAFAHPSPRDLN